MYINCSQKVHDRALSTSLRNCDPDPVTDTVARPIAQCAADPTSTKFSARDEAHNFTNKTPHFVITLGT